MFVALCIAIFVQFILDICDENTLLVATSPYAAPGVCPPLPPSPVACRALMRPHRAFLVYKIGA